jgi:hypothetical protein
MDCVHAHGTLLAIELGTGPTRTNATTTLHVWCTLRQR